MIQFSPYVPELSPADVHLITREKFRLFSQVVSELSLVAWDIIDRYGEDASFDEKASDAITHWLSLEFIKFADLAIKAAREIRDGWIEDDAYHDYYVPFRVGRAMSKSHGEGSAIVFPNGDMFPSYHDAAGFYNFHFRVVTRYATQTPDGARLEKRVFLRDEIAKWARFYSIYLDAFLIGMNTEAAGAMHFLGAEKYNAVPTASAPGKREYQRFAKPCPQCSDGTLRVGTKKSTGVRHLYCNKCSHGEKVVGSSAGRYKQWSIVNQLED